MTKFEMHEHVRVKGIPVGDPDEFAWVQGVYEDGRYWITNINMPYMGTISAIVSSDKIEKIRKGVA